MMHRILLAVGTLHELMGQEGCRNIDIIKMNSWHQMGENTAVSSFCAVDTNFQLLGTFVRI